MASHPYSTHDALLGQPIVSFLKEQGADVIFADIVDRNEARELSTQISKDLYWTFSKEIVGGIEKYRNSVDGIIFIMTFPCGPDSLVLHLCQNKIRDIPMVVLTLDELQAEAGLKTRLESFVDVLTFKKQIV